MTAPSPNPFEPPASVRPPPTTPRWRTLVEAAAGVAGAFAVAAVAAYLAVEFAVSRALAPFGAPGPSPYRELATWAAPWLVWFLLLLLLRRRLPTLWRSGLVASGLFVCIQVVDRLT